MIYTEVTCTLTPCTEEATEIMMASMGEIGFDSFSYTDSGFKAYIPADHFSREALEAMEILTFLKAQHTVEWSFEEIENRDWNKIWEENFSPIQVGDRILVRASFHPPVEGIAYDIVIDPKMSFGTGHHATTALMLETILDHKKCFEGKRVLDMGCGTGILSIMAVRAGAVRVTGIDIDEWAYRNAQENLTTNGIDRVEIRIGDASLLEGDEPYDIILANINRNILLEDMPAYCKVLTPGGQLIMSGFYTEDLPMIIRKAESLGLNFGSSLEKENWVAAIFNK